VICWGELVTWRASRQHYPPFAPVPASTTKTVVVLGYPTARDGSASLVQRYRVRVALRDYRDGDTMIFCGGVTRHGVKSEAEAMADYAVLKGLPATAVVLEDRSRSTSQNIEYMRRLVGSGPVVIASNTFHARRARKYLWKQDPTLAGRLRRGSDYRSGELLLLKPLLALFGR
jgi:vancomycin permeability regulator SanA